MRCNISCCEVLWNEITKHDSRTGYLFSCLTNKRRPVASVFIALSNEYHCDLLSGSRRRLFNLPARGTRRSADRASGWLLLVKQKRKTPCTRVVGLTSRLILVHWSTTVCKNCIILRIERFTHTPLGVSDWGDVKFKFQRYIIQTRRGGVRKWLKDADVGRRAKLK